MQRECIDLSASMIFAQYGIENVGVGYLIAMINFSPVVWIAVFTEFMRRGGWMDPAHLLVYYAWACLVSGIFFFNFGTWWMFFIADCVCFCMATAGVAIATGISTNAGIQDTHYSKNSFTAYRSQVTAGARLIAGPVARGSIFYFGRNGYAIQMAFWLIIFMYNNVTIRSCFLDKSDGYSEEDAQAKGVKRGGI